MTLSPALPTPERDRPWIGWVAIVVFAVASIAMNIMSDGFLEADGVYHYLYARYAFEVPAYFTDVWGRPIRTLVYCIPAQLGDLKGVRAMSLLLAIAIALLARRIAIDLKLPMPTLVILLTLAQPLVFLHTLSELTELPFALLLAAAFWCFVRRWWCAMAILVGLLPLSRPEGFGFVVLAIVALSWYRRPWWIVWLGVPLLVWSYFGWVFFGRPPETPWWRWVIDHWPYSGQSAYQPGHLLKYVAMLPMVVGPAMFPATLAGIWQLGFTARDRSIDAHLRLSRRLVVVIPMLILVGHSILHWRALMASSGEVRYLLIVAPFWSILGAVGWVWIFRRFRLPQPQVIAAVLAFSWAIVNLHWRIIPLKPEPDWIEASRLAEFYQTQLQPTHPVILANHPGIVFHLQRSPIDVMRANIEHPPAGAVFIWDQMFSMHNADSRRIIPPDVPLQHGWTELPAAPFAGAGWRVFITNGSATDNTEGTEEKNHR